MHSSHPPAPTLLCVSLLATSATNLRPAGLPLGPGEFLLLVWMMVAALMAILNHGFRWSAQAWLTATCMFWSTALVLFFFGFLRAQALGLTRPLNVGREFVAFGFVASAMCMAGWVIRTPEAARTILRKYALTVALVASSLLVGGVLFRKPWLEGLWYLHLRFAGFSSNPNQLALFLAPLPFVIMELHRDREMSLWTAVLCTAGIVAVGLATLSDALFLSWAIGGGIAGSIVWARFAQSAPGSLGRVALVWLIGPLVLTICVLIISPIVIPLLKSTITGVASEGAQASIRLLLWKHGFEALAASPWVGWGPGAHSGLRMMFEATEAHNSYLDWASNTGIPGLGLLLAFLFWALVILIRGGKSYLMAGFLALCVFSAFHFVLRQPAFWLILLLSIIYATDRPRMPSGFAAAGNAV